MKKPHLLLLAIFGVNSLVSPLFSQRAADPDPTRYGEEMAKFAEADDMDLFPKGGIVFVGSSSIRRLDIAAVFPGLKALNRGFGGSQISDVIHYIEETVLKYEPSTVVMYCGGNDLWARKPALQVLEDFNEFKAKLFECLPECGIISVSCATKSQTRIHSRS